MDRILTKEEMVDIETMSVHWASGVRQSIILDLCASHRLLNMRIEELEELSSRLEAEAMDYATQLSEIKEK